ncbi:MAG: hypothetical protein ACRYFW_15755 [Janthinobacterium lividum]
MRILLVLPALAALSIVTSCVAPPRAPVASSPSPVRIVTLPPPAAPVVLPTDWRDWPQTSGDWTYRHDGDRSSATFGLPGADLLTLTCVEGRRLRLSRGGPGQGPLTIRTSSATRLVQATPSGGTSDGTQALLSASDPLLDAIGFSRGRFVVEQAGAPPLVLPAWAEVERVVQDCRD